MQPHHPVAAASVEDDASSRQSSPSRPASPAQDQLPQEEEPVWHEDALPLSVTTKRNKVVLDLHTRLSSHFPSLFHQDVVDVPYYEEQPPAAPLLVLDPDLSKTWLRPPPGAGDTGTGLLMRTASFLLIGVTCTRLITRLSPCLGLPITM